LLLQVDVLLRWVFSIRFSITIQNSKLLNWRLHSRKLREI
jgi:hypothetical protein